MSAPSDDPNDEFAGDGDLLAAEYALGALDAREMRAVEHRAGGEPLLQRAIQIWVARLAPLSLTVRPQAPPPQLWTRLAVAVGDTSGVVPEVASGAPARRPADANPIFPVAIGAAPVLATPIPPAPIFPAAPITPPPLSALAGGLEGVAPAAPPPPSVMPLRAPRPAARRVAPWGRTGFWQGTTAFAAAIAAGLAAFILVGPPPAPRTGAYMGALMATGTPMRGFIAHSEPDGSIMVASLGTPPAPVTNRDMELWALPPGASKPVSLGVMPQTGMRVDLHGMPRDQTQLMISLEPAGGSPVGAPTGPVMYSGKLASLN